MSRKQSFQFFTVCIGLILFGLWLLLSAASCTVMDKTKDENFMLEPGQKLVTVGWNGVYIHYATRPMRPGETAEVYKIFEPINGRVVNVYEMGSAPMAAVPEATYAGVPPTLPWPILPPVLKDPSVDDDDSCTDASVDGDDTF